MVTRFITLAFFRAEVGVAARDVAGRGKSRRPSAPYNIVRFMVFALFVGRLSVAPCRF